MTSNTTVSKCLTGRKDKQVESFWSSIFKQFRKNKLAVVSFYVLLVIILACIFVPIFSQYTMEHTNMQEKSLPPTAAHWFGTDDIGRDLLPGYSWEAGFHRESRWPSSRWSV